MQVLNSELATKEKATDRVGLSFGLDRMSVDPFRQSTSWTIFLVEKMFCFRVIRGSFQNAFGTGSQRLNLPAGIREVSVKL